MVRISFPFVAGSTALDFLNTEVMAQGQPADLLESSDDLLHWLAESGLAGRGDLQAMHAASPRTRESWLQESLQLRNGMRALFTKLADGQSMRDADLRPINDTLSGTEGHLQLQRKEPNLRLDFLSRKSEPPFLIARSAATFLASADLTLIRRCQGEGCILFFHDTTKSHTRRWCSMATCGNRTKVKAHYARSKG